MSQPSHVVSSAQAQKGTQGESLLACGEAMALRLWNESAGQAGQPHGHDYETLGYVISGSVELELEGETTKLQAGDSWVVPSGAEHRYRVLTDLVAIEATSPPARSAH